METIKGYPSTPKWVYITLGCLTIITIISLYIAFLSPINFIEIDNPFSDKEWIVLIIEAFVGYLIIGTIWYCAYKGRRKYMKNKNFSKAEIKNVFSNRESFNLDYYKENKDSITLKKVDGFPRKSAHLVLSLFTLFYTVFVLQAKRTKIIFFAVFGQIVSLIISRIYLRKEGFLGKIFYGVSSRIRDGKMGRLNMMVVRYSSFLGYLLVGIMSALFDSDLSDRERKEMLALVILPTSIGDAMGELVGSVYGKHKFKVIGVGEINYKSIEGTIAVFLGALIPISLWMFISSPIEIYKIIIIVLTIATSSCILELLAPRATDNMVLPLSNLFWVYLFFKLNWFG